MGYQTPTLVSLLEEAKNHIDAFNNNAHRDLCKRIDTALRYSAANDDLHALAEAMAQAYETGESRDMHCATKLYRLKYPKTKQP